MISPNASPSGVSTSLALRASNLPARTDTNDISIADFWRTIQKRRPAIVTCVVVCTMLAAGVSLLMTPKYEAISSIEVNKEVSDVVGDEMTRAASDAQSADSLDFNITLETQAKVLKSPSLAYQVSQQLGLEKREEFQLTPWFFDKDEIVAEYRKPLDLSAMRRRKIAKVFEKNLSVKPLAGTRLIEVRFLSPDPQVAANVVNTLVSDYLDQYFRTRYNATAQASEWLSKELSDLKNQVEASQQKLVVYQKQAGILGADETNNVTMTRLEELNKQVTAAEANRILAETVYQAVRSGNAELISNVGGNSLAVGPNAVANANSLSLIQGLRAQQAQLKMQYAQAATKYGSEFPTLVQMRNQLSDLEGSIQNEVNKLAARAENDYRIARQSEDLLQQSFNRQKAEAERLNDAAIHYTLQKHEVAASRSLYDGLLSKLKEAGVLAGLRSTNIVVVDPARTTAKPASPKIPLIAALGFIGGLLGGVALAFLKEGLDTTIRTAEQIETIALLPAIAIVPDASRKAFWRRCLPGKAKARELSVLDSGSDVAEAFRSLRTCVTGFEAEPQSKVFIVTSALPQEGKSTTSLNAAITLAQQGSKVLLVDADLRRPQLHAKFRDAAATGLSDLIQSGGETSEYVHKSYIRGLSVLTAGERSAMPAELLGSSRMKELVNKWRAEFDYVVIDTPPVLAVTDPVVLSRYADSVIFVVRYRETRLQSLLRARDLLMRGKAKIAGVLVNQVDVNSPDYFHSYGYYAAKYEGAYSHAAAN